MEAVSKGASENSGMVIGILPNQKDEANRYVNIAIPTGMGIARMSWWSIHPMSLLLFRVLLEH